MGYAMYWAAPGRVLETSITGQMTLEELRGIRERMLNEFLPSAQPPVMHSFMEITDFEGFGFTIKEFMDYPQAGTYTPQQQQLLSGWRIYFGKDDTTFRFITSVFHQSQGHRVHWLPTRQEAIEFLLSRDDSLKKEDFD
jgi:hypothetical protein